MTASSFNESTLLLLGPLALFALVSSITPGPNNIMLASSGLTFGFRRTIPHMLGVNLGFTLMLVLVGLGLGTMFQQLPWLYTVLKYAGAFRRTDAMEAHIRLQRQFIGAFPQFHAEQVHVVARAEEGGQVAEHLLPAADRVGVNPVIHKRDPHHSPDFRARTSRPA